MTKSVMDPTRLKTGVVYREMNKQGCFYYVKEVASDSISFDSLIGSVARSETRTGSEAREITGKLVEIEHNSSEYLTIKDLIYLKRLEVFIKKAEEESTKMHPDVKEYTIKDLRARGRWFRERMQI